jgi:dihydroorotate dehydrogenase electron transfer subunit
VDRYGTLVEVSARLPQLAASVVPGQFAQLRCGDAQIPLLRRPFSLAWAEEDRCGFVLEAVGAGTRLLAVLRAGDIVDALGPLGTGFTLDVQGPVVCLAGGVGCAPFPLLIRRLRDRGVADILVLNGAATAGRLYPAGCFTRGHHGIRVREATDDGSRGHRGRVTELLDGALDPPPAAVYACGPNPMLAVVARLLAGAGLGSATLEASLEAPMGCGFGTCLGCALPVKAADAEPAWALCCTDGPVMAMRNVDWHTLLQLPGADVA